MRALELYALRVDGQPLSATEIMGIEEIIRLRERILEAQEKEFANGNGGTEADSEIGEGSAAG
jgi:hypothetical protein